MIFSALVSTFAGLAALAFPAAAAEPASLAAARQLFLTGKYSEAGEMYGRLPAANAVAAAIGRAGCLSAIGKIDEAAAILTAAAAANPKAGSLHAELALLALARGDAKQAGSEVQTSLRLIPDGPGQAAARWVAAELDRRAGRLDEATARL